ncbi:MAG: glutathione S-transferase family protein [Proteobacteria bacterium]|nr:glutathione S-transferase family protein [Pseudomonadota bacterium]
MNKANDHPLQVYGVKVSYFTGKLENYLRYKEIPYEFRQMNTMKIQAEIRKNVGVIQVPNVKLPDGSWMTDTTPMIRWFEDKYPDGPVVPENPEQAFFCLLLEDYADEWLWRPAMHYRWHYQRDALSLSRFLSEDVFGAFSLPKWMIRRFVSKRQRSIFTTGDGIHKGNIQGIEATYLNTLDSLQAIFEKRPFLLGDKPSLADIGFSGPMFRHFSIDPTAALIMRETAPAVYEWTARLWNARHSKTEGSWLEDIPDDWAPILDDIGAAYLPYLCANVEAWKKRRKRFDALIDGVEYRKSRTSHYRVWCLEMLQKRFLALPEHVKEKVQARLDRHRCWEPLWRYQDLVSNYERNNVPAYSSGSNVLGI